jgi:hypothetical protein
MDRRLYVLSSEKQRGFVANVVAKLTRGWRVEIKGPVRTLSQNDLMWSWLTAYQDQATYHGETLSAGDWKDLFTGGLKAAENGLRIVPGMGGGFMVLGLRTSDMTKEEMSKLIAFIESEAGNYGVSLDHEAARDAAGGGGSPKPAARAA